MGEDKSAGNNTNGWETWSKHVLIELERLNANYSSLSGELQKVQIELASIKEKATIFGALSGAIVLAIGMGIQFLRNTFGS